MIRSFAVSTQEAYEYDFYLKKLEEIKGMDQMGMRNKEDSDLSDS
jgi:hypothetical protein